MAIVRKSYTQTVDIKDAAEQEVEADSSTFCQLEKHQLILDEQIGIRCRFCSFVKLEIKYILPSFNTSSPWERACTRTASDDGDFSIFDGFPFLEKCGDLQGSYVHTTGTVWDKFPGIRKKMYPHQQEGFEFLWRNLAGGIDLDVKNSNCSKDVGGCVISHAPGTGKTFLTIVFLRTFMEIFKECRPVIIAPCNMLLTWEEEFKKWKVDIPFHNLNSGEYSGKEDPQALKLVQNKPQRKNMNRMVKLVSWSRGKSILRLSYQLFEKLAGERPIGDRKDKKEREILCDKESDEIRKILLEKPGLLVLDEGHTPRNARSRIWKALNKIKTERRIILSGTPFQNNFEELYNTLWLVRPKFADRISCKTQGNRGRQSKVLESGGESRGKWASLTSSIGKNADDRLLEEVRAMIGPFVHVHRGSILQKNLPGLRDCVVVLNPPPLQKQLLEEIEGITNSLKLEHEVALVSVHPSLLEKCSWSGKEKSLIDKNHEITSKRFKLDPNEGVKTRFLMELMKLSDVLNERVLVFSQFIDPISLIKDQLQSLFNWTEGNEVLQMDGQQDPKLRQSLINSFNDPTSKVKVLLASTKACREGINLIGDSRIVLLDVVWNPSVERQAISRAYRLGQTKVVYTYHLIASGTMEEDKYCRQVQKDRLSKMVFSTEHRQNENKTNSSTISDDRILDEMVGHEKLKDILADLLGGITKWQGTHFCSYSKCRDISVILKIYLLAHFAGPGLPMKTSETCCTLKGTFFFLPLTWKIDLPVRVRSTCKVGEQNCPSSSRAVLYNQRMVGLIVSSHGCKVGGFAHPPYKWVKKLHSPS
ncbi:SNF2-related [Macleaya cordata]|uniref:SNF2-related n=1 Tax=Macleaya cordata TaxID=56857 RepID=A0A200QQJ8_MACCD|nr:SNF2-related [Macleaya cordata]